MSRRSHGANGARIVESVDAAFVIVATLPIPLDAPRTGPP
jgi:hypothetical protein